MAKIFYTMLKIFVFLLSVTLLFVRCPFSAVLLAEAGEGRTGLVLHHLLPRTQYKVTVSATLNHDTKYYSRNAAHEDGKHNINHDRKDSSTTHIGNHDIDIKMLNTNNSTDGNKKTANSSNNSNSISNTSTATTLWTQSSTFITLPGRLCFDIPSRLT